MSEAYLEKFNNIAHFLSEYEEIHQIEFLKKYPSPYPEFLREWIQELKIGNFESWAQLESSPHEDLVSHPTFKNFLKNIRKLSEIEEKKLAETKLSDQLLRKVNPKKRHEIQSLKSFVDHNLHAKTILDLGGGSGHLSCALISETDKNALCIDRDAKLQEFGQQKIVNWNDNLAKQINFINEDFSEKTELKQRFDPKSTAMIALHSCGALSVAALNFALNNEISELINFGCCYHKLENESSYNLSTAAKVLDLKFSANALHLAGRSSSIITAKQLEERFKFKSFRYSLHYYLFDHFNLNFSAIGNGTKSDYAGSFAMYAKKYSPLIKEKNISDQNLEKYYFDPKTKNKVLENFLADNIRLQLGRLIELYLILDRVIYLQEKGKKAQLYEFFDRSLSPRNLMIFVQNQ